MYLFWYKYVNFLCQYISPLIQYCITYLPTKTRTKTEPGVDVEVPGDEVAPHLLHRVLLLLGVHQVNVRRKPETEFSKFSEILHGHPFVWYWYWFDFTLASVCLILCGPNSRGSGLLPGIIAFENNRNKENHFDFHVCLLFLPPKTSRACRDQGTEFLGGEAQNQPIGSTCHHCLFIMSCYVFTYVLWFCWGHRKRDPHPGVAPDVWQVTDVVEQANISRLWNCPAMLSTW